MARGSGERRAAARRPAPLGPRGEIGEPALARDLRDVADYFLPPGDARSGKREGAGAPPARLRPRAPRSQRPAALPILAVPVSERDVVRAAFAWNLVVEIARLGASATLLARRDDEVAPLWPEGGPGPVGSSVALVRAADLGELHRAALDLAVTRAADVPEGGLIVVCVPPTWLREASVGRALLRWVLLFSAPERRDLLECYALAKRVLVPDASARVGVAIHGAQHLDDARRAFEHVADVARRHLGRNLESYGLLVDDLHVYRAIVSNRPIGIEHPQSRAARALRDVAHMVLEDARTPAVA